MLTNSQHICRNAVVDIPLQPRLTPVVVPLSTFTWWHEKFKFHLFEFSSSKNEIARCNFVSKTLAHLRNSKRRFFATGLQNICKIYEHSLGGLRAKINRRTFPFNRTSVRFEHQVESPCVCELTTLLRLWAISVFNLVLTKTSLTNRAVHKWVTEVAEMSTGFKHLRRAQNCRIDKHDVITLLHHRANPSLFDVAKHQRTQWAIVI